MWRSLPVRITSCSAKKARGARFFCAIHALASTTSPPACVPATSLLTGAPAGAAANGQSSQPSVDSAGDQCGFYVAGHQFNYDSTRDDGHEPDLLDAVLHNRCFQHRDEPVLRRPGLRGAVLVSASADGLSAGNGNSYDPAISSDGEFVAFVSLATNLVTSDALIDGITPQVYVRTLCNPTTSGGVTTTTLHAHDLPGFVSGWRHSREWAQARNPRSRTTARLYLLLRPRRILGPPRPTRAGSRKFSISRSATA